MSRNAGAYRIARIAGSDWVWFKPFTFAGLIPLLAAADQNPRIVAIGASLHGDPAGLALAEIDAMDCGRAELRSLALAADHRGTGVGKRLLNEVEEELKFLGCSRLDATFPDDNAEAVRMERLFRSAGWAEPRPLRLLCRAKVASVTQAPWIRIPYPSRFEVFPWKELTVSDRADIFDRQSRKPWFADLLSPFRAEHRVHADVSLGLRFGGRVVGWCIGLVHAPAVIWVDSLFASNEIAIRGRAVPLLGCFIRRLPRNNIVETAWHVDRSNTEALRFTVRRLRPWCHYARTTSRTFKNL
jgi:GNAT superfamily N-acetyltransferase